MHQTQNPSNRPYAETPAWLPSQQPLRCENVAAHCLGEPAAGVERVLAGGGLAALLQAGDCAIRGGGHRRHAAYVRCGSSPHRPSSRRSRKRLWRSPEYGARSRRHSNGRSCAAVDHRQSLVCGRWLCPAATVCRRTHQRRMPATSTTAPAARRRGVPSAHCAHSDLIP